MISSIDVLKPLVSVIIPIHETNPYYIKTLRSVVNQNYPNIEILLIDSSLHSLSIPNNIAWKVHHHRVPVTFGISDSLNYGIKVAQGEYLARLDSDDLCLPDRIVSQVNFLQNNPDIVLVGSAVYLITDKDERLLKANIRLKPINHEAILLNLLDNTSFFHPTVMFRKEILHKHSFEYRRIYDTAEDYDLWVRLSHKLPLANLSKPLVGLRMHAQQYSKLNKRRSDALAIRIKSRHLIWMFLHRKISMTLFLSRFKRNLFSVGGLYLRK